MNVKEDRMVQPFADHAVSQVVPSSTAAAKSRIRLLKFVALFGFGGTERQVVNLTRMLDRSRFEPHFGCLERWGHFLEEVERQKIPVQEYPISSLRNPAVLRQQWRLAVHLRRERIQVVHSYNFYANVFAVPAARFAGAPVVIASIRDAGVYLTPAQKLVQRLVVRYADCVLVNAEAIRQWLIDEGYRADNIRIIRNGIDLSRFALAKRGTGIRASLNLPADAPVVVMLARLNPKKGLEYFLQAAQTVGQRFPAARFLVVGDGFARRAGAIESDVVYLQSLKEQVYRLGLGGRIVFTGFRADVPELLAECAVSVLPSLSEGLSNTVLESMAAGVPVVATRVGGNTELIDNGISGLLVPPQDAAALAEAISAILGTPELGHRLGQEARRKVTAQFSLSRMANATQDLYEELVEQHVRKGKLAAA